MLQCHLQKRFDLGEKRTTQKTTLLHVCESESVWLLSSGTLRILLTCPFFWIAAPDVNLMSTFTRAESGLFSVQSTLEYRVTAEDKDAHFSCEASFFVPGAVRKAESSPVNVTVHCEWSLSTILCVLGFFICLSQRFWFRVCVCVCMCVCLGGRERNSLK